MKKEDDYDDDSDEDKCEDNGDDDCRVSMTSHRNENLEKVNFRLL